LRQEWSIDALSSSETRTSDGISESVSSTVRLMVASRVRRAAFATAAVLVLAGLAGSLGPAAAAPKPTVAQVQAQLTAMRQEAEATTEKYNGTRDKLAAIQVQSTAATTRVTQQRKIVDAAMTKLARLAAEAYKSGDLQALSLLLDDDPQARLAAGGLMASVSDREARAVARVVAEKKILEADQADLAAQKKSLTDATNQLAALKTQITAKIAATNALLARMTGAERDALARASRSLDRQALSTLGVTVPASGMMKCSDVAIESPSARVSAVIAFACAQLGKPYGWGDTGPGSYDCSGLTLKAWARGGVSLPRVAADQANAGRRVSVSSLQPGDLIFFHGFGHEGLYIGKGLMIHAPHTGDVVRIAPARMDQIIAATRV
jgi:cell wall-associated NlpC family hydrolase